MTKERKAELFDKAMGYIYSHLQHYDETEYEETLEEVGFTNEEIAEEMKILFAEDED